MTAASTVVGGWAVAVSRAIDAMGYDGDELLQRAGIDLSRKFVHDARFTSDHTRNFWKLALQETGCEDIGLRVAQFVCPTTFHALGFSLWASATLFDALTRMDRFDALLNDGCELELSEQEGNYRFAMNVRSIDGVSLVSAEGVDYFFGAVIKLLREMKSPGFVPLEVNLCRPPPRQASSWQSQFGCPVNFSAADNSMLFKASDLTELLATGNPELAKQNDRLVAEYLERHSIQNVDLQVEVKLAELMPYGISSLEAVAEALNLNSRTLKYRLSQKGSSFKAVLNNTRQRLAKRYLQYTRKSFSEIAYSLGFSDPSHFNRAFKRWTGETPTEFRKRH